MILILDDATSDVDALTEVNIKKTLGNLMKNRSKIVIVHCLSIIIKKGFIILFMIVSLRKFKKLPKKLVALSLLCIFIHV